MIINKVSPDKHKYLQIIASIDKCPSRLYYFGKLPETRLPSVAIVGTRKPTAYGKEVTHKLAYDLAARGVVIVSGLALGVDGIAHSAALEAGGTTIAVLANALPDIRPVTNRDIGERIIASGGAILSEADDETLLGKWSFLQRNRIVAGISDAILITEASSRSGTLNTAARALEQGKEVFVVPGNITSPMSVGCNQLLKQGARLVTSVDDILEVIAPQLLKGQASLALGNTPLETAVLEQLRTGMRDGDELQQTLSCTATDLNVALTMLEVNSVVRALGGNQWTIR